jgi:hypothetical protein
MCAEPQRGWRDPAVRDGAAPVTIPVESTAPQTAAVITSLQPIAASTWPGSWREAEVVDGELVIEAPRPAPQPGAGAGLYDASGRPAAGRRFGRHVSVLA